MCVSVCVCAGVRGLGELVSKQLIFNSALRQRSSYKNKTSIETSARENQNCRAKQKRLSTFLLNACECTELKKIKW